MSYEQYVIAVFQGICQILEAYQIDVYLATLDQARSAFRSYMESRPRASLSLATDLYDHRFRTDFENNWLLFQVGMLQAWYRRQF